MDTFLKWLIIVVIIAAAVFIIAVILTCVYVNARKKSNKKRKPSSIWEDTKRNWMGLPWTFTRYALDEERFYVTKGLLSSTEDEVRLYRITDVSLRRSLWQKITGTGTVHCFSSDKTLKNFDINNIKGSEKLKEMLSEQIEKQRESKHVYTRETMMDGPDMHDAPDDEFEDNDQHM